MSDLSENITMQKWYIECKRYNHSLDWPAVYNKISYADNQGADFLLLITTANLSPRCKEEIASRENTRMRPRIRVWDAPVLESIVLRHDILLAKYGLSGKKEKIDRRRERK